MMRPTIGASILLLAALVPTPVPDSALARGVASQLETAPAVEYRLQFPEPEHRWVQVEAIFEGLPAGPFRVRMSRSSPGRYALHEFAKNVYDVHVFDENGMRRDGKPAVPSLSG